MATKRNSGLQQSQARNSKMVGRDLDAMETTKARRAVVTPEGRHKSVRDAAAKEGVAPSTISRRAKKGGDYRFA